VAVFVDTSGFYALADRADPAHEHVRSIAARAARRGLVTTDYVLLETMLLIEARLGYEAALRFWGGIRGGASALLGVLGVDLARAWTIVHEWPDQAFGMVDATSP
jgi:predicted nucleic acid-binding protein